jgi:hypothetical protein
LGTEEVDRFLLGTVASIDHYIHVS